MATINKTAPFVNHEGAKSRNFKPQEELERALLNCFLWEPNFYETGESVATRISELITKVKPNYLSDLVLKARTDYKLRHAPIFICAEMFKIENLKEEAMKVLPKICKRPDDLTELVALYWRDGKKLLPKKMRSAIGESLHNFDEYQLAKYQNRGAVKLIDLFNLCHPIPGERQGLWSKFIKGKLDPPVTWEVMLSKQGNTKETWEELIKENKLGGLAYLRNIRNMEQAGVDKSLIKDGLLNLNAKMVLPFRFLAAAKHGPRFHRELEKLMFKSAEQYSLSGKTVVLVDVSGSMDFLLSQKSDLRRMEAACALAMIMAECCKNVEIYTFSEKLVYIPPRRGFALLDIIAQSQPNYGTYLGGAVRAVVEREKFDRLIIITDEQSHDTLPSMDGYRSYIINVGVYDKGVSSGQCTRINGFSENVIRYIEMLEERSS